MALQEELFGPVATRYCAHGTQRHARPPTRPVRPGRDMWTRDAEEQRQFIDGLEAEWVFVNEMVVSDARLPFGG